jgi:hypothetical protein
MDYRPETAYAETPVTYDDPLRPMEDLIDYVREYSRQKPEVVAFTCFAVGFILGWKLKPW